MNANLRHYDARPDGYGGVTLIPKGQMARSIDRHYRGVKFTDNFPLTLDAKPRRRRKRSKDQTPPRNNLNVPYLARSFLPGEGRDQEDPDGEMVEEQLVGQLPEPPENSRYVLERESDGSIVIVLVSDDHDDNLNTNDRTYRHRVSDGIDPVLKRMNQVNRGFHSRDAAANIRRTIFRHVPLRSCERMELVTNPEGSVDVVLITPVLEDPYGETPNGAAKLDPDSPEDEDAAWLPQPGDDPGERQQPTPTFRDHRISERDQLKAMNSANKRYWGKR